MNRASRRHTLKDCCSLSIASISERKCIICLAINHCIYTKLHYFTNILHHMNAQLVATPAYLLVRAAPITTVLCELAENFHTIILLCFFSRGL